MYTKKRDEVVCRSMGQRKLYNGDEDLNFFLR